MEVFYFKLERDTTKTVGFQRHQYFDVAVAAVQPNGSSKFERYSLDCDGFLRGASTPQEEMFKGLKTGTKLDMKNVESKSHLKLDVSCTFRNLTVVFFSLNNENNVH